jgi:L-asparaginase II
MSEILVEVRRGGFAESVHRGNLAVADASGALLAWAGDPETVTFMRSAAKPLQALAVVETGAYEAFGLDERELAVICASHGSEPHHVEVVLGILEKLGLGETGLECGTHWPSHQPSAFELARQGRRPTSLHCNCSGKHAGMLAVARHMGWPVEGYFRMDHPVQRLYVETVAAVTSYPAARMWLAVDGCGATVVGLPLRRMAQGFARLADPDDPTAALGPERRRAAALIVRAMRGHPEMVAGTGRLCTALMRAMPVVAKSGAEGVYCLGLPGRGLGLAVKIEDGNSRAVAPVVERVLGRLGCLTPEAGAVFEDIRALVGKNHRGEPTVSLEAVFELSSERGLGT